MSNQTMTLYRTYVKLVCTGKPGNIADRVKGHGLQPSKKARIQIRACDLQRAVFYQNLSANLLMHYIKIQYIYRK
jgi:hypothetical protein